MENRRSRASRRACRARPHIMWSDRLPAALRELAKAQARVARVRAHAAGHKCPHCWLTLARCICASLERVARRPRVDVVVSMHYAEWLSGSNTGKLLPLVMPDSASLLLHPNDSEALQASLAAADGAALLWPGPSSRPAADARQWVAAHAADGRRPRLFVLDGTWAQVKAMARRFPAGVPRLSISGQPSAFASRRASSQAPARTSTVEAVAAALSELGEPEEVCRPLLAAMRLSDAAAGAQRTSRGGRVQP